MSSVRSLLRHHAPASLRAIAGRVLGREIVPAVGAVRFGDLRRATPIARDFGLWRGGPVDRFYIERFLDEHRADVRGRVLEVGDDAYTQRYGGGQVTRSDVLHVEAAGPHVTLVGDLADGSFLPSDAFDCVVLTQTLHLIYDFRAALATLARVLAPGGVLLLTVPGISNLDPDEWGSTWHYSFTQHSVARMCADAFPGWQVTQRSHGNVLAAVAFLHGLGQGELHRAELDHHAPEYAVVHTARVRKPG